MQSSRASRTSCCNATILVLVATGQSLVVITRNVDLSVGSMLAANDNIAGAVIADLKAKKLKPLPLSPARMRPSEVSRTSSPVGTAGTVYKFVPAQRRGPAAAAVCRRAARASGRAA